MSAKRKAPGTQAPRCLLCRVRPATAKDLCVVCEGRVRRDREAARKLGIRLEAFQPEELQPRPELVSALPTLHELEAAYARGVNYRVLYRSPTAIVESVMDPATGFEVNRLTCAGDTWPVPPLRALLAGEEA